MTERYHLLVEHYEACLERHGDSHRGVDWPDPEDAAVRYAVMLDLLGGDAPGSLLDLGCGAGHLLEFMQARGSWPRVTYVGSDLSARFEGALPVVYTGVGLLEAVGLRWRTQIHENAKHPAVGNVFPELDHNEIMGFESGPPEVLGRMQIVVLRDRDDHAQVQKRFAATRDLVEPTVGGWTEVETEGESRLSRMLSLVQLGDWVSFWQAMRKGVDPTPVETIQQLKKTLAA